MIIGVGSYLPPNKFGNDQLEAMRIPGVNAQWTKDKLNIESRRLMGNFTKHSPYGPWIYQYPDNPVRFMATEAAEAALEDAEIYGKEIKSVIVGTTTNDTQSPSVACYVAGKIQSIGPAFDVSAACAGFGYALNIADRLGLYPAMVIGVDAYSTITDWNNRSCVFFGDGAGAVIIDRGKSFLSMAMGSDGLYTDAWKVEDDIWVMDGELVWDLAVQYIVAGVELVVAEAEMKKSNIDIVIPHQPGIGVLVEAAEKLGIPFDKVHTVMDKYANTASASVPIALHDALMNGKIKEGDLVCLVTVGAGWVWSATLLRWT